MKNKKFDFKKFTEFIKKRNFIIAIGVLALTGATLSVSYASFFSVKTNTNNQSITTGTLEVSFGSDKDATSSVLLEDMTPMSDEEGMAQEASNVIYIQNTGTLDSQFTLDIGYDLDNFKARAGYSANDRLTPIEFIKFALYEYKSVDGSSQKQDVLVAGPLSIGDLQVFSYNSDYTKIRYLIFFNTVGSTTSGYSTKTYKLKMWLSDKATPSISNTYFYVNTKITANVEGAQNNWIFHGKIVNSSGSPLSGVAVNFHNGSIVAITDSKGEFTLKNVTAGHYTLDVTYNGVTSSRNINVVYRSSGFDTPSVGTIGNQSISNNTIFWASYNYQDTVNQLLNKNNITVASDTIGKADFKTGSVNMWNVLPETDVNLKITLNSTDSTMSGMVFT